MRGAIPPLSSTSSWWTSIPFYRRVYNIQRSSEREQFEAYIKLAVHYFVMRTNN